MTEDEMVGWHHRLNGHEFGWTPGVVDGQGALACCGSWGRKELDMTVRLNCTEYTQSTVQLPSLTHGFAHAFVSTKTSLLILKPKLFLEA